MKIYTKTGDKGTTRLVDGSSVEKFNPRVEAYGTVDELNSHLGLVRATLQPSLAESEPLTAVDFALEKIQRDLFSLGSLLATADVKVFASLQQITSHDSEFLEKQIDSMTQSLTPLKNFILPGGHIVASHTHIARTICRRAERRTAELLASDKQYSDVLIYLNRLSDYLFTLSRYFNFVFKISDVIWKS